MKFLGKFGHIRLVNLIKRDSKRSHHSFERGLKQNATKASVISAGGLRYNNQLPFHVPPAAFCSHNDDAISEPEADITSHMSSPPQTPSVTSAPGRKLLPAATVVLRFSRIAILCFSCSWEEANSLCRRARWVCN